MRNLCAAESCLPTCNAKHARDGIACEVCTPRYTRETRDERDHDRLSDERRRSITSRIRWIARHVAALRSVHA